MTTLLTMFTYGVNSVVLAEAKITLTAHKDVSYLLEKIYPCYVLFKEIMESFFK